MYNLIIHKNKSYRNISLNKILKFRVINGNFCVIKKRGEYYYIFRDQLGTKKLFWSLKNKKILISDNFIKLLKLNKSSKNIKSFKSGFLTIINKNGKIIKLKKIRKSKSFLPKKITDKTLYPLVRNRINNFLKALKNNYGDEIYVCLSGGLDSTVIAYLASKIFKKVTAVSCSIIASNKESQKLITNEVNNKKSVSKDFLKAKKISEILGIEFKSIFFTKEDCLKSLKRVMYLSQDWRDYNVHCSILNYQIAKSLKKDIHYNSQPLITGDFMNEFAADYEDEKINNKKFYEIPIKDKKRKQQFLINGLKSSDRENGVFNYFGIPSFQPYSSVLSIYENLPKSYLDHKNIKYKINGKIIDNKILKIVNKQKIRAQVGGSGGGILGVMIKNKIDQKQLIKIFTKNFNLDKQFLNSFIFLGDYRS